MTILFDFYWGDESLLVTIVRPKVEKFFTYMSVWFYFKSIMNVYNKIQRKIVIMIDLQVIYVIIPSISN